MLRAKVLELVRRRLLDLVLADQEAIARRHVELEIEAVGDHVEGLGAHHRIEADEADVGRLAEQDVGADVLVLGDLALLGRAEGGHHIDFGAEVADRFELTGDAVQQRLPVRGEQRLGGAGSLARDQAAAGQAGREANRQQADENQVHRGAAERHQFIVGSG